MPVTTIVATPLAPLVVEFETGGVVSKVALVCGAGGFIGGIW